MLEKVRERSVHLMIAHILVVGGSALAFFWLATILDPEIYGAFFFYVTVINLIMAVSVMGFQHVIMHQIPRLSEQGNNSKLSQLIHDSCNVSVTLSFFCAVLFCGWHYFIHPIPIPGADYSALLLILICPIWAYFLRKINDAVQFEGA
jgi:O-antigen/teichoic acid export membrane protein